MNDVFDELERLNDRAKSRSDKIGEGLYLSAGFFVDYDKLIDRDIQNTIRKYIYSKISNTPPYISIQETPASFIEDFIIIDEETREISESTNTDQMQKRKK